MKLSYLRLQWRASCKQERTVKVYPNLIFPTTRHLISPFSSLAEYCRFTTYSRRFYTTDVQFCLTNC